MKTLLRAMAIVGSLALVSSACATEDDGDLGETAPVTKIQVTSDQFTPQRVTVKVGDTVRWTWAGGSHNVVSGAGCAPDGNFKSGAPTSGASFERIFDTAGTFPYYCEPHCTMGMTGEIVVEP